MAIAIKLIAYVAYTIAIIVAIKALIEQILEQLLPKKRDHLGMRLKRLFEKGCEHLELSLSSSLLDNISDWVIQPSKNHKGGQAPEGALSGWKETGTPGIDDSFDTFGDLIRVWSLVFNAEYKIVGDVFHFERKDFFS